MSMYLGFFAWNAGLALGGVALVFASRRTRFSAPRTAAARP
jgi:hypothetical protein